MRLKKWNVILAITWMCIAMLMTVWMTASSTPSYAQSGDDGLAIDTTSRARDRSGNVIISDSGQGLLTVTINLQGQDCPAVPRERPVDVVLVVDVSGSMQGARLNAVKASIAPFLSRFNLVAGNITSDQIALVVFDDNASIAQDFSRDASAINSVAQALTTSGQTNMAAAFQQARYLLEGRNVPPNSPNAPAPNRAGNAVPAIVVLTDGAPNNPATVLEQVRLSRISLPEVQIATIAFGQAADDNLMRQISDVGKFFEPDTDQELLTAFDQIATLVQPKLSATDVRVEYTLNNGFILGDMSRISPPPTTVTTNSIIWEGLGDIYSDDTVQFTFEVEARTPGTFDVGTVSASYLSCGEPAPRTPQIAGPQVIAQVPTATPSPTNTPTPTITPTPTATTTPPPPAWTNPEAVTTTPTSADVGVSGALCEPSALDWLPVVIAILLLLIALWIIRRGYKNLNEQGSGCRDIFCWLIRSAFLLWLVWVIFLFLQPVMNTICTIPESVYFWRMQGTDSGIYVTNDFAQAPAQVRSMNEQGCVGCHTVSSTSGQIAAVRGGVPGRLITLSLTGDVVDIPNVSAVYSAFSPDGARLAYTDSSGNLSVMNIATRQITPIPNASDARYGAMMPTWSHDGQQIAYVRYERANTRWNIGLEFHTAGDIYLVNPTADATPRPLVTQADLAGLNYYPAFSPDGKWLAFTHAPSGSSYSNPSGDIWLLDIRTQSDDFSSLARPIEANSPESDTWATWNRDGTRLAFNTTRADSNYDIVIADVSANGTTTQARPLRGASSSGVFEHLPFWGEPPARTNLIDEWRDLLPWLIPLLILGILMLLCLFTRNRKPIELPVQTPPPPPPPPQPIKPKTLDKWSGITELWKPQPALIIGVGVAGWHVLTQIKKGLVDAGIGTPSEKVRLLCIMAKDQAPLIASDTFTGTPLADYEIVRWQDSVAPLVENAPTDPTLSWVDASYLKTLGDAVFNPQSGLDGANRQLGRLALINNLRGNNRYTQQNVVDYLDATIDATAVNGILTAIIISDLSDDVGAGAVLDVATLIRTRHRQKGGSTTRLIGHLMTARATATADTNKNSAVNTVASLRELERFQLAANAPFQLRYGADPALDAQWDSVLFDEVNLHDGNLVFGDIAPQLATYPAIADSILLWLDESSHKDLYTWVDGRKNAAKTLQAQRRQMIIGGVGVYQYRLPFADILEDATVRYARQLLLHLISGREGNNLNPNPALSEDVFLSGIGANIKDPSTLASHFMRGAFGYGQLDRAWAQLLATFVANNQMEYQRVVNAVRPDMPADADQFEVLLKWVVIIILNGEETPRPDHMQKKGAKLAFAMSFVEVVRAELEKYSAFSAQRPEVMNALGQFGEKAQVVYRNLEATYQLLVGNKPSSVRLRLDTRKTVLDNRQNANARLRTRRYITTMPKENQTKEVVIADEWYTTYLFPNIREGMSQFIWQLSPQGEIALTVKLPQREQDPAPIFVPLTENTAYQFELALLELGRYFARKVRHDFNISDVLANTILRRDTIQDTANTLMNQSVPLVVVSGTAPNQSAGMVFSANSTLTNRDLLLDLMREPLLKPDDLKDLKTGDPFTITLARTVDLVPISAVANVDNDVRDYLRDVFSQNRNRPTAVFNAERNALIYEGQLGKIKQATRVFHPLIVTALAKMRQTEVYLIAAAVASIGEDSAWSESYDAGVVFNHPHTGKLSLSASNTAKFFPLLDGLLQFTQVVDETTAEKLYNLYKNTPDVLDSLYEWSQTDGKAWREAIPTDDDGVPNPDMERVMNDLIAIVKILAVNLG